ncbi:hypothetical protein FQR65_LT03101 [Abscondita terminalis]|nr:hypothetical protein FQR65_LT03101 [Abscondita terminalis]
MNGTTWKTVSQTLKWVINTLIHQSVAVLACYMIWVPIETYKNLMSWHVILCTLGIFPLATEAFLLFHSNNVWSQEIQRKSKYWVHAALLTTSFVFEFGGVTIAVLSKSNSPNPDHFQSTHVVLGLLTSLFLLLIIILKIISISTRKYQSLGVLMWCKLGHNILGQVTYLFCITTLCTGIYTTYFSDHTSIDSRAVVTTFTLIISLCSLMGAWKSTYKQILSIRAYA